MAVINSLAIGAGVKSSGNITYRRTRGRTIASQRITENKSNTAAQQAQRGKFKVMTQFAALMSAYIDMAYSKTKYGSARNQFITQNKMTLPDINAGKLLEVQQGKTPLGTFFLDTFNINGLHDASCVGICSYGDAGGWIVSPSGTQVPKSNAYPNISISNGESIDVSKLKLAWLAVTDSSVKTGLAEFGDMGIPTKGDGILSVVNVELADFADGMCSGINLSVADAQDGTNCLGVVAVIYDGKIVTSRYCIGQKSA